jgi:hypothetical protein
MATKCISVVQESMLDQAKRTYLRAKKAYYNDEPIMTDAEFDSLEDKIRKLHPTWKELKKTGTKIKNKKIEVPLEQFMPSLNKMYPEGVDKFFRRPSSKKVKTWILTDKLDGTSLQLVYANHEPVGLFTRGDGTLGGNISFFLPELIRLRRVPARIKTKERVVLRIEGLMKKRTFEKHWASKFDNIRNMVNGIFNRQDMHPALKHVDLVVLGVYGNTIAGGLHWAAEAGFTVVPYHAVRASWCSTDSLIKDLGTRREASDYEMDGRVLAPGDWIMEYKDAEKPKATIAFKFNNEAGAHRVEVLEEIWKKTRLNRWSCKVRIPPTKMDGVVVEHATAHNPEWMRERNIGKGAIIRVLRSGGVIPKIVDEQAIKPGKFQGPPGEWEMRGRFAYAVERDDVANVRALHHFMVTLGVELLAEKSLKKMYDAGYTEPAHYIDIAITGRTRDAAAAAHFLKSGFGQIDSRKKANELIKALAGKVNLKKLMVASNCFEGLGEKKLTQLEEHGVAMADMVKWSAEDWAKMEIHELHGFKDKTVSKLIDSVKKFRKWYVPIKGKLDIDGSLPNKKVKVVNMEGKLYTMNVSWTTYRSKEEEARVVAEGGNVIKFGAKTDVLLYRPGGKLSTKIEKAGSKAMTWEQFCKRYSL